ncbi:hypothetical protein B0H63DRAFT_507670 [Podospora didyma]|uniref:GIY-YIG domain-containing protein n=1 Tax=Podospora didyma TaxID=330526 RepID=A0AAE0U4B4_9PEZI|nr:hypothetical protein B0H63DRAFT_507670 [Podospora didyma]
MSNTKSIKPMQIAPEATETLPSTESNKRSLPAPQPTESAQIIKPTLTPKTRPSRACMSASYRVRTIILTFVNFQPPDTFVIEGAIRKNWRTGTPWWRHKGDTYMVCLRVCTSAVFNPGSFRETTCDFIKLQFELLKALYDRGWIFQHSMASPSRPPSVAAELEFQRLDGQTLVFARFDPPPAPCEWFGMSLHYPRELLIVGNPPAGFRTAITHRIGPMKFGPKPDDAHHHPKCQKEPDNPQEAALKLLDILDELGYTMGEASDWHSKGRDSMLSNARLCKTVHETLAAFVAERDWSQFHTPENLSKSIAIEAGELLECFQWGPDADPKRVREELADVLTYCLLLAARIRADPEQMVLEKLEVTRKKYPVDKARGSSKKPAVAEWKEQDERHSNWPVVYVLDDGSATAAAQTSSATTRLKDIYIGESLNAAGRLRQHLDAPAKQHLKNFRVIMDGRFNKSVCLDLESYLIKMLAGDGANRVLNRNNGITESNYFQRDMYCEGFRHIFEQLRADGVFTRTIPEIEISDLFKLSPFKALTEEQANSVEEVVRGILTDMEKGGKSMAVIQGDPGAGKTVVATYLIKLLIDIKTFTSLEDLDSDLRFANFFTNATRDLLQNCRIGLVVPQQSLRSSIKKVFRKTPGLNIAMVLTPFERANQPSGVLNAKFATITRDLFGSSDDTTKAQLDWVLAKSRHQAFLLDTAQSVRPADLPTSQPRFSLSSSSTRARLGFVSYVRWILDPSPLSAPTALSLTRQDLGDYDFRAFASVSDMRDEILRREAEVGLSRLMAGYAWEWKTRKDKTAFDLEFNDGLRLRWNITPTDWMSSDNALEEVGSIHTVQGYDLNYVGVIIGMDLRFDVGKRRLFIHRASYFDKKGKENNPVLGRTYSDDDLLRFIMQIYAVLMTRGIKGTLSTDVSGGRWGEDRSHPLSIVFNYNWKYYSAQGGDFVMPGCRENRILNSVRKWEYIRQIRLNATFSTLRSNVLDAAPDDHVDHIAIDSVSSNLEANLTTYYYFVLNIKAEK